MKHSYLIHGEIEYLMYAGALVIRINSGAVQSEDKAGRRRFFSFVRKTPARRNNVSQAQRDFMAAWHRAGGIAFVATGIEDVQRVVGERMGA